MKIYGYKESDVLGLINYIRKSNCSLNKIFFEYAKAVNKSQGTIRNLYYAIVRKSNEDKEFCDKYLLGKSLKVLEKHEFSKEEERKLLEKILNAKASGKSVRSAISQLSNGDEKLALRYQNKYRMLIKKKDKKVFEIKEYIEKNQGIKINLLPRETFNTFQKERVKSEIDKLVSRISFDINNENIELKQKIVKLQKENELLKNFFKTNSISSDKIV